MRRLFAVALLFAATGALTGALSASVPANDRAAIQHALSRLTYGARPGDIERVEQVGLAAWIDLQLNPSRIDDSGVERRLTMPDAVDPATPQEARRAARQGIETLGVNRMTRALYSERQLEEILVDFWFNHFNVFAGKGRTAVFIEDYEQNAIRPHVMGRFRDLLGATARHPAMLFYLDNWMSVDPDAVEAMPRLAAAPQNRRRGLNENYARELLELHTLGVDGGYTQADVVEVARAFTGWSIGPENGTMRRGMQVQLQVRGGAENFRFMPAMHDRRAKVVLGRTIAAGGDTSDGERVLDIVAAHSSTARHIATKLARRFVSDTPPASLVSRAAARFTETDGNIREVVRTIITSDEFFAASARNAKVKTPLEFVVSAVRVANPERVNARAMLGSLRQLGMPLFMCEPPTGYDDTAETWISPGALVSRINIAQQLGRGRAEIIAAPEFQRR